MKYAICIDNSEPVETFEADTALSERDRQAIAKDFCKRHDIGASGVCVRQTPKTMPVLKEVRDG
jgi:hypothetical protein